MGLDEFTNKIFKATGETAELDAKIREAVMQACDFLSEEESAGIKAATLEVVEVAVAVINMFLAVQRPGEARTLRTILDLTITLNNNTFWAKHAPSIVPMLQSALMGHMDAVSIQAEKIQNPGYHVYEGLVILDKAAALPIVSYLLYLLGGPNLYLTKSVQLKTALYPLLVK